MSYRLRAGEPVEDGLRRLAADQIGRAFGELDDPALGLDATVHQVRKRCKKLRGLLRLVRPALAGDTYAHENAALRDAQGGLSDLRDAEARIEAFDALVAAYGDALADDVFGLVREALEARRRRARADGEDAEAELGRLREALGRVRERARGWKLEAEGFEAVRGGLVKTYRRGRRGMAAAYADGSDEAFHEWRKRVKYHGYHMRLLRETWKPAVAVRRRALGRLGDLLGDEHDLAVLRRHLRAQPVAGIDARAAEALHGLIAARRARLRAEALPLGRRLFADRPKALARRMGAWLEVAWGGDDAGRMDETSGIVPPGPSPLPAG